MRIEYVVSVEGTVRLRPKEVANARMATGSVEVIHFLMGISLWCFRVWGIQIRAIWCVLHTLMPTLRS